MSVRRQMSRSRRTLAMLPLLVLLTGCAADYEERIDYLRDVGLRGVEVNNLLKSQGSEVNEEACRNANVALNNDTPNDIGGMDGRKSDEWKKLVEQTFLKACTLGKY